MHWDSAIIVLRRKDGAVLGVTRGRKYDDINFPGGHREKQDKTPVDTIRRELMEEAGVMVDEVKPLAVMRGNGRTIVVFKGKGMVRGLLRASSEGVPVWCDPAYLMRRSSSFRRSVPRLLELAVAEQAEKKSPSAPA